MPNISLSLSLNSTPLTHPPTTSVYSAYEHSLLSATTTTPITPPTTASSSSSPTNPLTYLTPHIDLPLDITLETLLSVLLICTGVVLASPDLKPIQWRVWAGKLEKEKAGAVKADELGPRGNPYTALEQRQGFLDIRRAREEFAGWVKEGGDRELAK